MPPWSKKKGNYWFFVGQIVAVALMVFVVYVPIFHDIFKTRNVPVQFLFLPLAFCAVIFALDEARKLLARKDILCFKKIGW